MKRLDPKTVLSFALLSFLVVVMGFSLQNGIFNTKPSADEYYFTRITMNLPNYSTSSSWVRVDRPDLHWEEDYMPDKIFEDAYEKLIWVHPPMAHILAWPYVKLVSPDYEENWQYLKILPTILFGLSLTFVYLTLRKRFEGWKILIGFMPISLLYTGLHGVPYLYYDGFMVFMLTLTIYLISRGSKFKYLTACLLFLTKTPAIAFAIPLLFMDNRNFKMLLPMLSVLPYYIMTWVVSGDMLYIPHHWMIMQEYTQFHYEHFILANILDSILYSGIYIFAPIVGLAAYRVIKNLSYYNFGIIALGAIGAGLTGWAIIPYQIQTLLISIPFMVCLIIPQFTLVFNNSLEVRGTKD